MTALSSEFFKIPPSIVRTVSLHSPAARLFGILQISLLYNVLCNSPTRTTLLNKVNIEVNISAVPGPLRR